MDKKLLLALVLVLPSVSTIESQERRSRSMGEHVGGYGGSEYGSRDRFVGRLARIDIRTLPIARRISRVSGRMLRGDEKVQVMKELKDLREKHFNIYHASMLIAADELSKYMNEEKAKRKLQYIDDVLSDGADNKELFKLLEEAEIEEATQEDEGTQ